MVGMGKFMKNDGGVVLAEPSPVGANGREAVMPSVSFTRDGTIVTFTVVTEPGFLYEMEISGDLLNWQPVVPVVRAEGQTLIWNGTPDLDQRFYRFRRIP